MTHMFLHLRTGFLSFAVLALSHAAAANVTPDVVVENTINELIDQLESNRPELEQDKLKLYQMVEEVVVPHFEVKLIARLVLGKHWRAATEAQQNVFAEEFKKLLVRTYATALFEYTGNERMEIKPLRIRAGDTRTTVETKVILPGAPPVPVDYSFVLTDGEAWKIYDVKIDGISLVTTYRTSYGQAVESKGLDALIAELKHKNEELGRS